MDNRNTGNKDIYIVGKSSTMKWEVRTVDNNSIDGPYRLHKSMEKLRKDKHV